MKTKLGPHAYTSPDGVSLPPNWGSYLFCAGIETTRVLGARYHDKKGWSIYYV